VLLSEYLILPSAPDWLHTVAFEVHLACRDAQRQWMVAACLTIYFVTFLFIGRRPEGSRRLEQNSNIVASRAEAARGRIPTPTFC